MVRSMTHSSSKAYIEFLTKIIIYSLLGKNSLSVGYKVNAGNRQ